MSLLPSRGAVVRQGTAAGDMRLEALPGQVISAVGVAVCAAAVIVFGAITWNFLLISALLALSLRAVRHRSISRPMVSLGRNIIRSLRVFFRSSAFLLVGGCVVLASCALAPLALCETGSAARSHNFGRFALVLSRPSNLSLSTGPQRHWSFERLTEMSVLAVHPRYSIRTGSAVVYSRATSDQGHDRALEYAFVDDHRIRNFTDLFNALDSDDSGYLEPPEVWELRHHILRPFYPAQIVDDAAVYPARESANGTLGFLRDNQGRVGLPALLQFFAQRAQLHPAYRSFVLLRAAGNTRQFNREQHDMDSAEFLAERTKRLQHRRLVPLSAIKSVGLSWGIPWLGLPACPQIGWRHLVVGQDAPPDATLDTAGHYAFVAILTLSIFSMTIWPLNTTVLRANPTAKRVVKGWGLPLLVLAVYYIDPLACISSVIMLPTRLLRQTYLLYMVSRPQVGQWIRLCEYGVQFCAARGAPWHPRNCAVPSAFVRCPVCRALNSMDAAVQNVHGVEGAVDCCVCLEETSSVCLPCGHMCLCGRCFEKIVVRSKSSSCGHGLSSTADSSSRTMPVSADDGRGSSLQRASNSIRRSLDLDFAQAGLDLDADDIAHIIMGPIGMRPSIQREC